jgi:hypothetical protein
VVGKGYRRVNIVQILYMHDVNGKQYLLKLFRECALRGYRRIMEGVNSRMI